MNWSKLLCALMSVLIIPAAASGSAAASPAVDLSIPLYGGEALCFDAEMLEQRLNEPLEGITVTALPRPGQGELLLEDRPVRPYQYIRRDALEKLRFVPGKSWSGASLTLIPHAERAVTANVVIQALSAPNLSPIIGNMSVETAPGISVSGRLDASDPEGDALEARLAQKPEKGNLRFEGLGFVYTPYPGKSGRDRFTVSAVDSVGNYSNLAVVDITIREGGNTGFFYADMLENPSHYAAIRLYEKGVLRGRQIGDSHYFYPKRIMPRSDYLILLLAACGIEPVPCVNTGLPGDSSLPPWLKPYIKAGLEKKILLDSETFDPDGAMIRAEAVVWCDRAAKITDVKEFPLGMPDAALIPRWARQSYVDLAAYRMLDLYDGGAAQPSGVLTNDYAADLAWQLYKHWQNAPIK